MTPVFGHGRLRLYLLKLLDESPRHGYEVIRLLEERFHGLYAPSAGTVYPRLAKLEAEGLVSHATEGGRKVYRLTDAGRGELASRSAELTDLEAEIHDSVGQLAGAIRQDVRDNAKDLRAELWSQAAPEPSGGGAPWRDQESWQRAKEEFARLKAETKEQARRAKEQEKAARQQAKAAEAEARKLREQSKAARTAAQQEALRLKRRIEEQVRAAHAAGGDWSTGLAEGLAELTRGLGSLADAARWGTAEPAEPSEEPPVRIDLDKDGAAPAEPAAELPDWARTDPAGDPARELERLLDRFRDHVRDTARDRGVDAARLARAEQALAAAASALFPR
ncbi:MULTISPECIES: PadR family transcriptional regulator [Kitasatospora]|uniref:Putative PadR family transcriptional regulator n=1 Tax=Kitasatospora setae (strain ATCC 33774 / DSM 43861 / JCM 3304 / KCC A-0304 / NBRC 14216 / KM-6054) TaxID=452652 RepID=E4NGV7_KITSK|nr:MULTISPECIES: PadR family transcriptional regulator [Kitasatospora]BAJ30737.1 putative PadR family transcriptional regulator [Kitasatospora setae KM-6054]